MRFFHLALAVGAAAGLVLTSVAVAATHGAAGKSLVTIKELGSASMTADKTLNGRFSLLVDGVISDSGTTVIRPNQGTTKIVDGQHQTLVFGQENLATKKGTLTISFRGVSIPVNNINPAKDAFDNESGTWRVQSGSGLYKGWKGGGRWALVGTPSANNIEWDGDVSR